MRDEEQENRKGDIETALRAGKLIAAAGERILKLQDADEREHPFAVLPQDMRLESLAPIIAEMDARAANPRHRSGTARHQEVDSFIAHINRSKDEGSAIWADIDATTLTAILDYHEPGADGAPRWGRHRAVYSCPLSQQWKLWMGNNDKAMGQEGFGQFIEDNLRDIVPPDPNNPEDAECPQPAKVLEMARTLVVRTKGEFSRTLNPTTGEGSLVCKTENETSSTKIPKAFLLGIPVFEAGARYRIEARLRFAMRDGRPTFSYSLYQPQVVLRDAFGEVRARVQKETSLPLFVGTPE